MQNEQLKNTQESDKLNMLKLDIKKTEFLVMDRYNSISKESLAQSSLKT